ncbi:MAG: hypothetical protein EOO01_29420 [Chitinophagaceae bacterium]|nr:MAG: hypothetical protein EOO01_29420 [Chitinophagaceae bacterium]
MSIEEQSEMKVEAIMKRKLFDDIICFLSKSRLAATDKFLLFSPADWNWLPSNWTNIIFIGWSV